MIRNILFWILAAVFILIPLLVWRGVFFPYTFIKTIAFYILVDAALLAWFLLAFSKPEYRLRVSWIAGAVVLFLGILGITALTGVDTGKSIWSDTERMFGLITWLHLGALFFILSSAALREREWDILFHCAAGTGLLVAIHAVWQGLTAPDLAVATIGNAAYLSSYLVPVFFLALFLLFREQKFSARAWMYGAAALLMLFALVFTEARAGIVGLGTGLFASLILFLIFGEKTGNTLSFSNVKLKRIAGAVLVIGVLGAAVLFMAPQVSQKILPGRLQSLFDFTIEERTASGRILAWRVAWEGWSERLMVGWGPENFNVLFDAHYDPALYTVEPWFDRAHNVVFDVGSTSGVLGLLAYLGMFGAAGFLAARSWKRGSMPFWSMALLISLLIAHLAQNMFTFDTLTSFMIIIFVFGYIDAQEHNAPRLGYTGTRNDNNTPGMPNRAIHTAFGACRARLVTTLHLFRNSQKHAFIYWIPACAGTLILLYAIALKPLLANTAAHRGWELLRTGGGDAAAISQFEKSISHGTQYSIDARRFAAEYVFEFLKQGGSRPDASLTRLMAYAIEKMDENIAADPRNVKWVMYRGQLYSLMAQKFDAALARKAEEDFLRAKEMSPGRPQIYLELAQARKVQGDVAGAWEYLDYILQTLPEFEFGHLNAAVLAIETGNEEREKIQKEWFQMHGGLRQEGLRDAYYKRERFSDAVRVQEEIVRAIESGPSELTPRQRAVYYAHLAALYQKAGETEHAREAARKVLQLDPGRKSEVDAFLETL